ncbi:LysR substrate-binding domain-containing protein [Cohnella thailandensis]|uniref:LysR family transcriptional regulator n=1 Tax=Cohnella thailandensis TaxID=557557 RepID=A0A841T9D9_9BACL|nr:LysR family transcriptional regulator [Cohnella thailandensis]MBP1973999.1 DNA-binding transcriptional LysR family regulator [Cohnella thailandensis]
MNLEQMEYCLEVAKTHSITIASTNLRVTPSTISQAISRLEEELNLKLFERTRKGAIPLSEAGPILDRFKEVLDKVRQIKESTDVIGQGELKLSVIPGGVPSIVQTISSMKKSHPDIKFELSEKASWKIIQEIRDKQADIGLIAIYEEDVRKLLKGLSFQAIDQGKLFACVSKRNALAKKRTVTLKDLQEETFVLFNDEFVDPLMEEISRLYGDANVLLRTNNSEVIGAALLQLDAVTIGHEYSFANGSKALDLEVVKLELDLPQRNILIGWVMEQAKLASPLVKRFMERYRYEHHSR